MKKWIWMLALVCAGANAADWRALGSDDNAELSIDAASIKEQNGMRAAWSMWNFKEARQNAGDKTFPSLKSYQDLHIYDCKNKTLKLTREIIYAGANGTGDKRDHTDALKNMQFIKPAPGTIAESMLTEVCATTL